MTEDKLARRREVKRASSARWRRRNPEKQRANLARWHAANRERQAANCRRTQLKRYGLTVEDYDAILSAQGGKCAMCQIPKNENRRLAVDHDHATGRVRGLLCTRHNVCLAVYEAIREQAELYLNGVEHGNG